MGGGGLSVASRPDSHTDSFTRAVPTHTTILFIDSITMNFFQMVQQATAQCAHCAEKSLELMQCHCRQAYYCNTTCQRADWPTHKSVCSRARKGPLLHSFCAMCGKASTTLMSCPCENALYCSIQCQQRHFGTHRRTCTVTVTTFRASSRTHTDEAVMPEDTASVAVQTDESCQALLLNTKRQRRRAAQEKAEKQQLQDDAINVADVASPPKDGAGGSMFNSSGAFADDDEVLIPVSQIQGRGTNPLQPPGGRA